MYYTNKVGSKEHDHHMRLPVSVTQLRRDKNREPKAKTDRNSKNRNNCDFALASFWLLAPTSLEGLSFHSSAIRFHINVIDKIPAKGRDVFLGSGPDWGRSPVEWGDFPSVRTSVRTSVCTSIRPFPPLGHPARPEAQPARPEAQPAIPEA